MAAALPYPGPLLVSDADYPDKVNANWSYLAALIQGQIKGSELNASSGIGNDQIGEKAISGTKVATGSDGIPASAIQTDAVSEPKNATASILDADLDRTSVKIWSSGAVATKMIVCTKDVTISGTSTGIFVDVSGDSVFGPVTLASGVVAGGGFILNAGAAISQNYVVELDNVSGTTATFYVRASSAITSINVTLIAIFLGV